MQLPSMKEAEYYTFDKSHPAKLNATFSVKAMIKPAKLKLRFTTQTIVRAKPFI